MQEIFFDSFWERDARYHQFFRELYSMMTRARRLNDHVELFKELDNFRQKHIEETAEIRVDEQSEEFARGWKAHAQAARDFDVRDIVFCAVGEKRLEEIRGKLKAGEDFTSANLDEIILKLNATIAKEERDTMGFRIVKRTHSSDKGKDLHLALIKETKLGEEAKKVETAQQLITKQQKRIRKQLALQPTAISQPIPQPLTVPANCVTCGKRHQGVCRFSQSTVQQPQVQLGHFNSQRFTQARGSAHVRGRGRGSGNFVNTNPSHYNPGSAGFAVSGNASVRGRGTKKTTHLGVCSDSLDIGLTISEPDDRNREEIYRTELTFAFMVASINCESEITSENEM